MAKLTNEQKARLAEELITAAGTLIENWTEHQSSGYGSCVDIDAAAAAEQFGLWLARLPGEYWDPRLTK